MAIKTATRQRQSIADGVRDQKREHILEVAENLFFRQGYAGTTISGIVEHLGVTKPYLYYYFGSKSDIYETLCWQASNACLTAMHFEADDARPAIEKLREGLHRFASANVTHFKSGTFYYRDSSPLQPALLKRLRLLSRRFYDELSETLEQARQDGDLDFENTRLTARAIGSVAGFMYTWYDPDGSIAPEEMADQLSHILLKIAGEKSNRKGSRKHS
ncbi:TetR/AcrR family transcriptional regulator [Noviherbaspirillum cavernae]|uniref:TetR/AcrR family transcriptional regulator n=1 Tax=Noviherbaspirillum cavernae TaxID=2320862 RepID=A0A418X361_9BURK|nr:TetR/AcrR family transcriptional regulator [Noviherbaspirillum cavernae]RJG06900.1 TetR/AcrR family transcriptional regulator [Noviherbaspirillum cavernae]